MAQRYASPAVPVPLPPISCEHLPVSGAGRETPMCSDRVIPLSRTALQLRENPPVRVPCNIRGSLAPPSAPRIRNTEKARCPLPVLLRGLRRHGTLCVCKALSPTAPTSASAPGIALTGGHTATSLPNEISGHVCLIPRSRNACP